MQSLAFVSLCFVVASNASAAPMGGITAYNGSITVSPGEYQTANGTVTVPRAVTLSVAPAEVETIRDEAYVLSNDSPDSWFTATHLRACMGPTTVLPDVLVPGSVRVKMPASAMAKEGRDYRLSERWAGVGRVAGGRIPDGSVVLITYKANRRRLDTVATDGEGRVILVRGTAARAAPEPPPVGMGWSRLANIYRPYGATAVDQADVFMAGPPLSEPDAAEIARRAAMVPKTLGKLRAGKPVTIVAWGDSVTVGDDASSADNTYVRRFLTGLRARFPQSPITMVNAGISGSNTSGRLPNVQHDVLAAHPDLVTIEFVNDTSLPDETVRANWLKALDEVRAARAEAIVITPHFTWPEGMKKEQPRGGETRSAVETMRAVAKQKGVAVADASRRWAHLETEGTPYITLLANGINHPDNRGHELFARELLTFFPAEPYP